MGNGIKGLTVVFTGDGKGKTSAALGAVFRALGHGFNCKVIQFIKGSMETGELFLAQKLKPELEIVQTGKGFTWDKNTPESEHKEAAQKGLQMAKSDIASGNFQMVVLDEIFYALKAGLIDTAQIEEIISMKPDEMHLILTGRGAPQVIIDKADMVTNMDPVKHPMQKGIKAQKGLDY